nr:immunoglobulin heavy chain junction region [Mus musculus]MBK4197795.1 immunoglobulin heavy chain junction region [Mus musculus]
CARGWDVAYW